MAIPRAKQRLMTIAMRVPRIGHGHAADPVLLSQAGVEQLNGRTLAATLAQSDRFRSCGVCNWLQMAAWNCSKMRRAVGIDFNLEGGASTVDQPETPQIVRGPRIARWKRGLSSLIHFNFRIQRLSVWLSAPWHENSRWTGIQRGIDAQAYRIKPSTNTKSTNSGSSLRVSRIESRP